MGEVVVVSDPEGVFAFVTLAAGAAATATLPVAELEAILDKYTSMTEKTFVILDALPELQAGSVRRGLRRALAKRAGREDIQNMATKGNFPESGGGKRERETEIEALAGQLATVLGA